MASLEKQPGLDWTPGATKVRDRALSMGARSDHGVTSEYLLASVLLDTSNDPHGRSGAWLRQKLRVEATDEGGIFAFFESNGLTPRNTPRADVKRVPESGGYRAVVAWAMRAAGESGSTSVRTRYLVGGLLFAVKSEETKEGPVDRRIMAQFLLARRTGLEELRREFVIWALAKATGREATFWKALADRIGPNGNHERAPKTSPDAPPPADSASDGFVVRTAGVLDRRADEDALDFQPYVDGLARFLLDKDTKPPLTLSIEGEWGAGKSTFLYLLKRTLKRYDKRDARKERRRVVEFNPWRYDKDESLWAGFAEHFYDEVKTPWSRPWPHVKLAWERLSLDKALWPMIKFIVYGVLLGMIGVWLFFSAGKVDEDHRTLVKTITGAGAVILSLVGAARASSLASMARSFLGNPFRLGDYVHFDSVDYESKRSFLFRFQNDFERVLKAFVPEDRIFVFIDDLDRCEPVRAAELLQAIAVMFPEEHNKLITVLAIDREKVAAAVAMRSEKILPLLAPVAGTSKTLPFDAGGALEHGRSFMEKLVQLPIRLPRPGPAQLEKFLDKLLGSRHDLTQDEASTQREGAGHAAAASNGVSREPGTDENASPNGPSDGKVAAPAERTVAQRAVARESPLVRDAIEMVAPALGTNPRRLVQFLNVFRLQAYLADAAGLFAGRGGSPPALTLVQLAKLTAIGLRWPALAIEMSDDPRLIAELDLAAVGVHPADGSNAESWSKTKGLLELLAARSPVLKEMRPDAPQREDTLEKLRADGAHLTGVDVSRVFSTWPAPRTALPVHVGSQPAAAARAVPLA